MNYQLTSEFQPTGDQPKAIAQLVQGVNNGEPAQVLLGRHRHGQNLHHGQRHCRNRQAGPGALPQQNPGRPALRRVQAVLPQQRRRVLHQLLRLLPARGLHCLLRRVHREGSGHQPGNREAAPAHHLHAAERPARRDCYCLGVVHLRHRQPRGVQQKRDLSGPRPAILAQQPALPVCADPVFAHRNGVHARHVPGEGRHRGRVPGLRRPRLPAVLLRRRNRGHPPD